MLARSGLIGKNSSLPNLGPSEAIFSMDRENAKNVQKLHIFLGGPMGPIHPVWANGQDFNRHQQIVRRQDQVCEEMLSVLLALQDV